MADKISSSLSNKSKNKNIKNIIPNQLNTHNLDELVKEIEDESISNIDSFSLIKGDEQEIFNENNNLLNDNFETFNNNQLINNKNIIDYSKFKRPLPLHINKNLDIFLSDASQKNSKSNLNDISNNSSKLFKINESLSDITKDKDKVKDNYIASSNNSTKKHKIEANSTIVSGKNNNRINNNIGLLKYKEKDKFNEKKETRNEINKGLLILSTENNDLSLTKRMNKYTSQMNNAKHSYYNEQNNDNNNKDYLHTSSERDNNKLDKIYHKIDNNIIRKFCPKNNSNTQNFINKIDDINNNKQKDKYNVTSSNNNSGKKAQLSYAQMVKNKSIEKQNPKPRNINIKDNNNYMELRPNWDNSVSKNNNFVNNLENNYTNRNEYSIHSSISQRYKSSNKTKRKSSHNNTYEISELRRDINKSNFRNINNKQNKSKSLNKKSNKISDRTLYKSTNISPYKKDYQKEKSMDFYTNYHKNDNDKNYNNLNHQNSMLELLDNIKNKYQNQEKKYIEKEEDMVNEIKILREKIKEYSLNETNYQIEIEKLKRKKNALNQNINYTGNANNISHEDYSMITNTKFSDVSTEVTNNNINNTNLFYKSYYNLFKIIPINKCQLFEKKEEENCINDEIDYEYVFNKYPQIKNIIKILNYKLNKEYNNRLLLEEKTLKIFSNDIKTIDNLEKQIKKLEKYKKNNTAFDKLNGLNNSLTMENATHNSVKSCDFYI